MRFLTATAAMLVLLCLTTGQAQATNGDNLIGIGPISRAMGGVGVAAPQDAISAVFANPAAMCFAPYCNASEVNFSGTAFAPTVKARIKNSQGVFKADSHENVYPIPALGISSPISDNPSRLRFGFAAYGVSGMGVDYRDTDIDNSTFYDFTPAPGDEFPMASGTYTQLNIMKFAPALAGQVTDWLSAGAALHIDYATLDLGEGTSADYAVGAQFGLIAKPTNELSIGLNYVTPQTVTHERVAFFDADGNRDSLKLQMPQHVDAGVAYTLLKGALLMEADVKWINWSDAEGYEDFDWQDQIVYAVGAQYHPISQLALRAGYNYAENPLKKHDNFQGLDAGTGQPTMTTVQGKTMPTYYYETFRVIGFPAVTQHHLTLGAGWSFSNTFSANIGYVHGFKETFSEEGTDIAGQPVRLTSSLEIDSYEFGLTWRF